MNTNVVSFEDAVKNRVKSIVAELIPEDRYEAVVQQAIAEFESEDLPELVATELRA